MAKNGAEGVTAVPGVRCSSGSLGIKRNGSADAALFVVDQPATYAGVFTTNQFRSACVESAVQRLHAGKSIQAVLVTSGNANAGTGLAGRADTEMLASAVAGEIGCHADEVIVLHTGVIGVPLRAERFIPHIPSLAAGLSVQGEAGQAAAAAMMTTDTFPKMSVQKVAIEGGHGMVAGVAKGAGMIHPRLATMLSVVFTDCAVSPAVLQSALQRAVKTSFNAISVDGDTSPNDSVILLATGTAGTVLTEAEGDAYGHFCSALTTVCTDLAKAIVRDGEGATKFIEIDIKRAPTEQAADQIAATIATSPLVKTAFFGADFNPGRIVSAIGRSGIAIDLDRLSVAIGDQTVYTKGVFCSVGQDDAVATMAQNDIVITVDLDDGAIFHRFFTCDLTYDYVRINAEYTT